MIAAIRAGSRTTDSESRMRLSVLTTARISGSVTVSPCYRRALVGGVIRVDAHEI
jgi:hypothetical protein